MKDKERLELIKEINNYSNMHNFIGSRLINPSDLLWLIEQAERVQELEIKIKHVENLESDLYSSLEKQNKRYRELLSESRKVLDESVKFVRLRDEPVFYDLMKRINEALEARYEG